MNGEVTYVNRTTKIRQPSCTSETRTRTIYYDKSIYEPEYLSLSAVRRKGIWASWAQSYISAHYDRTQDGEGTYYAIALSYGWRLGCDSGFKWRKCMVPNMVVEPEK
jgi:hypothetical protein